jgi:hypothetical protein
VWRINGRLPVGLILVGAATLFLITALPRLARRRTANGHRNGHQPDRSGSVAGAPEASAPPSEPSKDASERNDPEDL